MEPFTEFIATLKTEEGEYINRTARNFFLDKIPFSFSVRLLEGGDLDAVNELQEELGRTHHLRQNSRVELENSLEKGVWIGVFDKGERLEAYTVFEYEFLDDNILLYLKATAKREGELKGFQKHAIALRKKLGGDLAAKSLIPFGGGYCTCHQENVRCIENLLSSGLYRLFRVKGLYGESPIGDRDIFGYGDIFELKELLFDKWYDREIVEL